MYALTIHQPWATLIATGRKTIETRGWLSKHRGPLAIHASVKAPDPALCRQFNLQPEDLPRGQVIAVVNVTDSRTLTADDAPAACCDTIGRCGLMLDNVRRLPVPVDCRGLQKLWHLPEDVTLAVQAQLRTCPHCNSDRTRAGRVAGFTGVYHCLECLTIFGRCGWADSYHVIRLASRHAVPADGTRHYHLECMTSDGETFVREGLYNLSTKAKAVLFCTEAEYLARIRADATPEVLALADRTMRECLERAAARLNHCSQPVAQSPL